MSQIAPLKMETLENLIDKILAYKINNNFDILSDEQTQTELKHARDIDYSIKTYSELQESDSVNQDSFIEATHGPKRLGVMLLNYFGEYYCNNSLITIQADDPTLAKNIHDNTYYLILKDIETHEMLMPGNPTSDDKPYDFDTRFIKQITIYPDTIVDTTATAWDSFHKGYMTPYRTLDFKSTLWTSGKHSHNVNYIIKLDKDGILKLFLNNKSLEPKKFDIVIPEANKKFYSKYFNLLNNLDLLNNLTWDQFITD